MLKGGSEFVVPLLGRRWEGGKARVWRQKEDQVLWTEKLKSIIQSKIFQELWEMRIPAGKENEQYYLIPKQVSRPF